MALDGISGIGGKYQVPQEPSLPEGPQQADSGTPSFNETLNILYEIDDQGSKSPFIFKTQFGNIDTGNKLVGTNVNFLSNQNIISVTDAMENPFSKAAPNKENPGFMQKV